MADVREIGFELERFGWTDGGLEVVGRWSGLEGRRLGRPVLTLLGDGRRRRLTALPGGHLRRHDARWRASFAYDGDPEGVTGAELEIGRRLVVDLPPPRRRRRAATDPSLRAPARGAPTARAGRAATLAARDDELMSLRGAADEVARGARGRERAADRRAGRGPRGACRRRAGARPAGGRAATRVSADLANRESELARGARGGRRHARASKTEQRLAAERAASTEVREKLATAREETSSTIEAESRETERLRAELETAREEAERALTAERDETSRLRAELATRRPPTERHRRRRGRVGRQAHVRADRARARARAQHQPQPAPRARRRPGADRRAPPRIVVGGGQRRDRGRAGADPRRPPAQRGRPRCRAPARRGGPRRRGAARPALPPLAIAVWAIRIAAVVFVVALLVTGVLIVSWVA